MQRTGFNMIYDDLRTTPTFKYPQVQFVPEICDLVVGIQIRFRQLRQRFSNWGQAVGNAVDDLRAQHWFLQWAPNGVPLLAFSAIHHIVISI